ncbi:MAG: phosphatase PAP2 family protein [Rhizobiaceae bacterium]
MGNNHRLVLVTVAVIALLAVIVVVWLPYSTVSLDPGNLGHLAKTGLGLLSGYLIGKFVLYRIQGDAGRGVGVLRSGAKGLMTLVPILAMFAALAFVGTIFTYLASATDKPLIDGQLAAIDAALGFHWPSFLEAANSSPVFANSLVIAYHSLFPQFIALLLVYSTTQRVDRALEFLALLAVSFLFTAGLMVFLPTAGAYPHFRPAPEAFEAFTARAGMWHYSDLLRLRSGEPFNLLVSNAEGLVTFPSYHTVVAIMIVYSLRLVPIAAVPAALLNATMIIGTLPEGGHHLVDVIAGLIVALVSIFAVWIVADRRSIIR